MDAEDTPGTPGRPGSWILLRSDPLVHEHQVRRHIHRRRIHGSDGDYLFPHHVFTKSGLDSGEQKGDLQKLELELDSPSERRFG